MNGTIKSINDEKGFGFIIGEDGLEYFFHKSAVMNGRFNKVRKGGQVTFEPADSPKGRRAEEVYVD